MIHKSKFYSITALKCPRCREGDLFPNKTLTFQKSFDMYNNCPVCNQKYVLETGFYYGAMFISYILSSFYLLGFYALLKFGFGLSLQVALFIDVLSIFLLFVYLFRVSRSIWIHFFVAYKKPI